MLDLVELRRRCSTGEQFRYLFFWGHQPSKDGKITQTCMSQWYAASFKIEDVVYPTAEHWMMSAKARLFGDDESLQRILESTDPKVAKAIGKLVKNFDDDVWTANCRRLVTEGNVAKFSQNEDLRVFLLGTEDQVLVEASPYDRIWGIGLKAGDKETKHPDTWQGQNLLGFALMDVRATLAGSQVRRQHMQVIGSIFTGGGKPGDFGWMIQQPEYADALFIFNDNEEQFREFRRNPKGGFGCDKGGGNAVIRPYQCKEPQRATGIPTGVDQCGYEKLTAHVRQVIDEAIAAIRQLLGTGRYQRVFYSAANEAGDLGTGIFDVGNEVKNYITAEIRKLR